MPALEAQDKAAVAFDLAQITSPHNRSNAAPNLPMGTLSANSDPHVATGYAVRRLLPIETEALQGFPETGRVTTTTATKSPTATVTA